MLKMTLFVAVVAFATAATASAQAPPNDDRENALEITEPFPYVHEGDLATATLSEFERDICGDSIASGVWYKFSPAVDTALTFFVTPEINPVFGWYSEDATGSEGGCTQPGTWDWRAMAGGGKTLYIFLGTTGPPYWSAYTLSVDGVPVNHVGISINAVASVTREGWITVFGTMTCESSTDLAGEVFVTQKSGHGFITGSTGPIAVFCEAPSTNWTAVVQPTVSGSKFVAGRGSVSVQFSCNPEWWNCLGGTAEAEIKLRRQ